jgi:hypothetical protein
VDSPLHVAARLRPAVEAFLAANAGKERLTFAEIRAGVPGATDGVLSEIFKALGVQVHS